MTFGAVLDACVLYPFSLCDTLLRLAERELYDPYWSDRILEELRRNLVRNRVTVAQAEHRIDLMRRAFPEAAVPERAIAQLEAAMTNEAKDRHVLAAAVASQAEAIVTFNLRDFPEDACAVHDIEPIGADEFLVMLHDLDPKIVEAEVDAQAKALLRPPVTRSELLAMLARAGVPRFAERIRA